MKASLKATAILATLALSAASAQANTTINLGIGDLTKANGSTALALGSTFVILVDADGDHSFGDLTQATSTFIGDTTGGGDQVLARLSTDGNLGNGGTFNDSLILPTATANAFVGKDLLLVWYDKVIPGGDTGPGPGVRFNSFRTSAAIDGSDIGWVSPADGQPLLSLFFLTESEGGSNLNSAGATTLITASVPEPASLAIAAVGGALMLGRRRRAAQA